MSSKAIQLILGEELPDNKFFEYEPQWGRLPGGVKASLRAVAEDFNVSHLHMVYGSRGKKLITSARQLGMYVLYRSHQLSQNQIASIFSKDQKTVSHGIRKITELLESNPKEMGQYLSKFDKSSLTEGDLI